MSFRWFIFARKCLARGKKEKAVREEKRAPGEKARFAARMEGFTSVSQRDLTD